MNKATKWVSLVIASAVCVSSVAMLAACGDDKPKDKEFTVTYYDGEDVLKTETVKEGEKAVKWEPTKTDCTFDNWYATPNFAHLFDFDAPVTENKSAFAKFTSSLVVDDTREFYICGQGQSNLLAGSAQLKTEAKMTKTEGKNEYTLTVDLYENDWFQFVTNTQWDYQRGWGYMQSGTLDGVEYFVSGGSMGAQPEKKKDIKCAVSGNYTFTLTTHPADDNGKPTAESASDTITWKRNGDVQGKLETVYRYYLKGEHITDWKDMYNPATELKADADKGVYTLSVYLKEGEQFMFASTATTGAEVKPGTVYIKAAQLDETSKVFVGGSGESNMTAKASGTYTFTYTAATETAAAKLSVAFDAQKTPVKSDYYIDGVFHGGQWNSHLFKDDYKFTESSDGVFELKGVELAAGDAFAIQAFKAGYVPAEGAAIDWQNSYTGNYSYLYYSGLKTLFEAENPSANNNNFKTLVAGTYDLTFNSYSKIITIKAVSAGYDIYINGNMQGSTWPVSFDAKYKFTKSSTEADVYELVFTFSDLEGGAHSQFGMKVYPEGTTDTKDASQWVGLGKMGTAGTANDKFRDENNKSNFVCTVPGTYKIVYNAAEETVDFYAVTNA